MIVFCFRVHIVADASSVLYMGSVANHSGLSLPSCIDGWQGKIGVEIWLVRCAGISDAPSPNWRPFVTRKVEMTD